MTNSSLILPEALEGVRPCSSKKLRFERRVVRVDAATVAVDMRMQVDPTVLDSYIQNAVELVSRIDNVPALQNQIVLLGRER